MQHEQIAQNEPASQTEQAAMPAWTQHVVAAGETGRCHRRRPRLRCRRQTLPLRRIELQSSALFRVRAVAASRRSFRHGTHIVAVGLACRRARPGPDVWKPLRLVRRRCSARYGGTYRPSAAGTLTEPDIVAASMRVAPGVRSGVPSRRPSKLSSWHVRWSCCSMSCVANPTWSLSIPRSFGAMRGGCGGGERPLPGRWRCGGVVRDIGVARH